MWLKRALGFAKSNPVNFTSRVRMPQHRALSFNALKSPLAKRRMLGTGIALAALTSGAWGYNTYTKENINSIPETEFEKFVRKFAPPEDVHKIIKDNKERYGYIKGSSGVYIGHDDTVCIETIITTERIRKYIQKNGLDLLDVPERYLYDLDSKLFVVGRVLKEELQKDITLEEVKQLAKLTEELGYVGGVIRDLHTNRLTIVGAEDWSFFAHEFLEEVPKPYKDICVTILLNHLKDSMDESAQEWLASRKEYLRNSFSLSTKYDDQEIDFEQVKKEFLETGKDYGVPGAEFEKFVKKFAPSADVCKAIEDAEEIKYKGFCFIKSSPALYAKDENIDRIINAYRMREYIQRNNLDRLTVPEKCIYKVDGKRWVVFANVVKYGSWQRRSIGLEEAKQLATLTEELGYKDWHLNNVVRDSCNNTLAVIDTEDRSFFANRFVEEIPKAYKARCVSTLSRLNYAMDEPAKEWLANREEYLRNSVSSPTKYDDSDIDFEKVKEEYKEIRKKRINDAIM